MASMVLGKKREIVWGEGRGGNFKKLVMGREKKGGTATVLGPQKCPFGGSGEKQKERRRITGAYFGGDGIKI